MKIEMGPSVILENLEDLYFELVPQDIDLSKKRPSYLSKEKKRYSKLLGIEAIKDSCNYIDKNTLKNIYLIGSEPIYNPDFNRIMRYCLHIAQTTVITGGQSINEKKARFMAKVQNEQATNYQLKFKIILYHYDERVNDTYCNRGDFRKVMHAINSLLKYSFTPEIIVKNVTQEDEDVLQNGFETVFSKYGIAPIKLSIRTKTNTQTNIENINLISVSKKLNCGKSRVYSSRGVFSCPNLVGDNRARLGTTLKSFSKTNYLETEMCQNCISKELQKL